MKEVYRAARYTGRGGPEVAVIGSRKRRRPKAGEVAIEVEASSVSASDVVVRSGVLPVPLGIYVPGYDLVGRVVEIGSEVEPSLLGRRTIALVLSGGNAELAYARPHQLIPVEEGLDPVKAAAMGLNYATALALIGFAPSGTLFFQGLTGGVGSALLDLSRRFAGLTLAGTVSPGTEHLPERYGAKAWAYDDPDVLAKASSAFPSGFDLVFDGFGGKRRNDFASLLRRGRGRLIGISYHGPSFAGIGYLANLIAYAVAGPNRRFFSIAALSMRSVPEFTRILGELGKLIAEDKLDPLVAAVYELDHLRAAQQHFDRKGTSGKIVVRVQRSR